MNNALLLSSRFSRWSGRRSSLRRQLIMWNILALALLFGVLGVVIRYTALSFLTASVERELEMELRRTPPPPLHEDFPPNHARPDWPPFDPTDERRPGAGWRGFGGRHGPPSADTPYGPHHYDLHGHSIVGSDHRPLWDPDALAQAQQGDKHYSTVVVDGEPLRVLSAPVLDRGVITAVVQIAYPLADINRAVAGMDRALLTLIPIGLLCAGLGGAYLTDRVLRRVRRTTQAAEQISAQDFAARLPITGNDEFSELAETFNRLLTRLESAFHQQERLLEQQRRFTADASHELKTPLTVIKGTASMALSGQRAEAAYQRSLQDIDRAADVMSDLVQDLLLLARSDGGQLGKNQIQLPVREVLDRAISAALSESAPITLDVEDEALCVMGNEAELVRLFSNLLENAVCYTPLEGAIRVSAQAVGESVLVCIADTGVGVSPEHLPHLGERFYRVDAARSRPDGGTGLGLSICKSIVEAHRGTLTIESVLGKGTMVRTILPRSQ